MRKLVTIRAVSDIQPIEGADMIERITVEGWQLVSGKGNFKSGDPCVYFEIDSFLPDGNPLWQDLVDKSSREFEGRKGHVLRTIKLRGQVSQGFAIPLKEFPEIMKLIGEHGMSYGADYGYKVHVNAEGTHTTYLQIDQHRDRDFADVLGVVKYEAPIPSQLAGQVKGSFPSFIRKTDQERCQNLGEEIFADLDARYEVTVKLDGTSMTVYHDPDGIGGVCSRNLELKVNEENKDNTMVKLAREGKLLDFVDEFPTIAIQGELMGPGIQGNRENLKQATFFMFDMFDIKRGEYLDPRERAQMWLDTYMPEEKGAIVRHVPILHRDVSLRELGITNVDQLLEFAEGKSLTHDIREGVVFKRLDGKFSFKAISNRFLLKQKD